MLQDDNQESKTCMAGRTGELLREQFWWHALEAEKALSCLSNEGWNCLSMQMS